VPLGSEYKGSRVSRNDLVDGESDYNSRESYSCDEDGFHDARSADDGGLTGAGKSRKVDENDESHSDESPGDVDMGMSSNNSLRGSKTSDPPNKEEDTGMEEADETSHLGMESEGQDEDMISIEGGPFDADTRSDTHEEDSLDEDMFETEQDGDVSDETTSDNESGLSITNEPQPTPMDDRATLRRMMAESQKTVIASISEAAKVDIAKGEAIAQQRTSFDALLNARIRLQKGIIAMNSLPPQDVCPPQDHPIDSLIYNAEAAAVKLWSGLEELRQAIQPTPTNTKKSLPFAFTQSTSTAEVWDYMRNHEMQSIPMRRATLTKWSSRLQPIAANPGRPTLSGAPIAAMPLTAILDQHLVASNRARLVARTQVPRSCAPVQAAAHIPSDPDIYDDADFYANLLRELVDRRMTDPSSTSAAGSGIPINGSRSADSSLVLPARERKPRRQVDTRASKGRKMRYVVHEKLQNFMAPEDRGSWGTRQTTELFGGLLGRRITLGEEEEGDDVRQENSDLATNNEEALLLFRR
jgi:protein AATF/BFR2